jgi:hypothetical protein
MTCHKTRDLLGRWWWVWLCNACGKQEKAAVE